MVENVIASRKFRAIDTHGKATSVEIVIGVPFEAGPDEWACPVLLKGLYKHRGPIFGVDSMQALMLAIRFIRDLLNDFCEKGGKLYWPDNSESITVTDFMEL